MKNLKKVLALVLVVATLLTMTTIASAKFTDADKIEYTEAVDVLTAINVLNGYTDGSFRPDGNVTRAQMAKMVAYIVAGGEDVGSLYAGANSFSDCTTHWAKGYIAYANKTGIVAGVGGGKFNPDGSVTGTQAAKMMLCALGYDAAIEEYTGTNWAVNTLADARDAGLLKGLNGVDMSKAMTREQAAQLMFNALQADTVRYSNKGSEVDLGNGIVIRPSGSDAEPVKDSDGIDYNGKADEVLQLCEKYFPDLELTSGTADAFGRPSDKWVYDKAEVGTYAKEADATYTAAVKSGDLYKDLGLAENTSATVFVDGENVADFNIQKGVTTKTGATGQVTEAFVDDDKNVTLVQINTYVGEVSNVVTAEDVKDDEEPYIEITGLTGNGGKFETSVDFAEDDIVLYTYDKSEKEIKSVALAEKVENVELTSTTGTTKFVADGTTYEYNTTANAYTGNLKDNIDIYLDANGYVVYVKLYEAGSTNYAFVLATQDYTNFGKTTYEAKLLLTDGSVVVVSTNDKNPEDLENKFVSYTVDDDDVYTLTKKDDTADKATTIELTKGTAKFTAGSTYYANSSTIFLVYDKDADEYTVYTGIDNVPSMDGTVDVYVNTKANSTVAKLVYISGDASVVSDANKALVYIIKGSESGLIKDADKGNYYTYDAVIDGKITTVDVAESARLSADVLASKLTYNSKNVVTKIGEYPIEGDDKMIQGTGTMKTTDGTVGLDDTYYTYAEDVAVFKIEDNDFNKVSVTSIRDDSNDTFKAVVKDGEVIAIFITVKDGNDADNTVKAQPTDRDGFVKWFDSYEGFEHWVYLPTTGLKQTVSEKTIMMSGKIDDLTTGNKLTANVQAGLKEFFGQDITTVDGLKEAVATIASKSGTTYTKDDIKNVGFVGVNAGGEESVACVFSANGNFYVLSQYTGVKTSYEVGGFTVNVSGLSF